MLEKTLESSLDSKKIKAVNSKGNQPWIFIGRTGAEAELLVLWPPWCKELTHWKRHWCWERLRQEEEWATEDEMVGWHHQLNGHEFEQALGDGEGQGSLVCCSSGGHRVRHYLATEQVWYHNQKIDTDRIHQPCIDFTCTC